MSHRSRLVRLAVGFACMLCAAAATESAASDDQPIAELRFARDIRPILAEKCFACHGPDDAKRKAKLRLDRKDDALRPREAGAPIVPGKPDESELVFRIESDDPTVRMPPPDSGKTLTPKQIRALRDWIEGGAEYTEHWAFVSPKRPPLPRVSDPGWVNLPLDAFVMARLDKAGLTPSAPADKTTLLRRLCLDLVGLPPTIDQIDAFLADTAPDAYDRLVERLLASPHYGERWARVWLDAARYADSDGYEKDKPRFVWFYRDWVIGAFDRDLPYDQFLLEQLAGDLLPNATQDQVVATGFLRNSMINEEGGIDPEQFRMEAMFDRMDAIGTGILGLTVKCAQCHNHKYDPLTQEEYYRMFAFLNDCHEANIAVYTPDEERKRAEIARRIAEIESEMKIALPDWPARMAAWEALVRDDQPRWTVVVPVAEEDSTGGQRYLPQPDGSLLAQGYAPTKHRVKLVARVDQPRITAFRLELLTDPNLPRGGPGRSIRGTGALSEFEIEAAPAEAPNQLTKVYFECATADVNPPQAALEPMFDDKNNKKRVTGPIRFAIDGNNETAWNHDFGPGRRNAPCKAVFVAETPIENPIGTVLVFYLAQNHGGWNSDDNQNCNLGRFRLSITDSTHPVADPVPVRVRELIARPPGSPRTPAEGALVFGYWRTTVPEWKNDNRRIDGLWKEHPEGATQLVLRTRDVPRETALLQRGDFLKPLKPVAPGVPAFLNPLPEPGAADRLAFARWITDRSAPTTARAFVNRVWQAYFGAGLVETAEDLGVQGALPTHPELLDWLAFEFMERGWSIKELHRMIVLSNTYRQSSRVAPDALTIDPANKLLARGPRFRIDAELVRDVALAASGLLNETVGGPSTNPPAPEFLFLPPASYGPKVWKEAATADRYRRGVYTFRYRSVPYPMLQAFDAPNGDVACARRTRSNTPLQALATLNEPIFMECARALSLRMVNLAGSDNDRIVQAFRRCLARDPTARETETLLNLLERQTRHFEEQGLNPWDLAANDPAKPPALPIDVSPARAAAWTAVARVLLNLDETITKE